MPDESGKLAVQNQGIFPCVFFARCWRRWQKRNTWNLQQRMELRDIDAGCDGLARHYAFCLYGEDRQRIGEMSWTDRRWKWNG